MIYIQAFNVGPDIAAEDLTFELRDADDNLVASESSFVLRDGMGTVHLEIPGPAFKGSVWIKNDEGTYIDVTAINEVDVMRYSSSEINFIRIMVVNIKGELISTALVELLNGPEIIDKEITGSDGAVSLSVTEGMTIRTSAPGYQTNTRVVSKLTNYIPIVLNASN